MFWALLACGEEPEADGDTGSGVVCEPVECPEAPLASVPGYAGEEDCERCEGPGPQRGSQRHYWWECLAGGQPWESRRYPVSEPEAGDFEVFCQFGP